MSSTAAAVYMLRPILDDPRYEGFGTGRRSFFGNMSLTEDFHPDERTGEAPRLSTVWRPPKVEGRVRESNDYPCVNLSIPAFSERAVEALRDLLEPNGELLPLASKLGRYYAYNVTTVVDALDPRKTDADYFDDSRIALWIRRHEFVGKRLKGLTIFRIPDDPEQPYVTDAFVARAKAAALDGLDFAQVWPLPKGVSWESLHKRTKRRRERKGLPKGRRIKGQSVFIRLGLSGTRPTREEAKLRDVLLDELDTLLVEKTSRKPAVGSLEGHACAGGTCELRLSCPDAAALVRKLAPWLRNVSWPGEVTAVKRDAGFDDVEANERPVRVARARSRST